MGNSIEVSNINANSIKAAELECNQTSMIPTLAASIQNMHVPTNLNDEARGLMTKINDHPTCIRTWKRLMHGEHVELRPRTSMMKKLRER